MHEPAATKISRAFLVWVPDLMSHLAAEERLLASVAPSVDPAFTDRFDEQRERMQADHDALRTRCGRLTHDLDADGACAPRQLIQLGNLLHDHIRFEERELFATLQQSLPEQVLADAAQEAMTATGGTD